MKALDSHQHFWQFDPIRDAWIDDTMSVIRRDFLPEDLLPVLQENGIDGCIAVQADQSYKETSFLLDLSNMFDFIKGVVGWVELEGDALEEKLEKWTEHSKFKGVRHILQAEKKGYMLSPAFKKGISKLHRFNLTYDVLIFSHQLEEACQLVSDFPDQKFVLDHIGKPPIKNHDIAAWKQYIEKASQYPNLYCKLSGFLTEADWKKWDKDDFTPYFDVVISAFTPQRIMFGSDWPVVLLAGNYTAALSLVKEYISKLSASEQNSIMLDTAKTFYNV